jgi:hypothetical protein
MAAVYLPASAQSEIDCDPAALSDALIAYAEDIANASDDEIVDIASEVDTLLANYLEACPANEDEPRITSPTDALFTIQATGNVNVRSCNETTCDILTTTTTGQVFSVVGEDGDWYEIDLGDGQTGFIASWLTTRGPDEIIDIYEGYLDLDLACIVQANVSRSTSNGLDFAISGEALNEVTADIYRPNASSAEPVWRQFDKTFIDTGDPYIHQVYSSSYWPTGSYQLHLERNGEQRIYGFDLTQTGETTIYVLCE